MPVFTPTISQQNTGISGGVLIYPQVIRLYSGCIVGDSFNREDITPTGAYTLYGTGGTGTPIFAIDSGRSLKLTTTTVSGDSASVRTSEFTFQRKSQFIDTRSSLSFDSIFFLGQSTLTKGFVGILQTIGATTTLPTTTLGAGVYWDTTAGNNFMLTSADGSTQTTTDTGEPISSHVGEGNTIRVNVTLTSPTSGIVSLYSNANTYSTLLKSQTISANINGTFQVNFFVSTDTTALRSIDVAEWWITTS